MAGEDPFSTNLSAGRSVGRLAGSFLAQRLIVDAGDFCCLS